MYAFFSALPLWVYVIAGVIAGYLIYRYWKYKKATAYAPSIARGTSSDFRSLRDNPILGKSD